MTPPPPSHLQHSRSINRSNEPSCAALASRGAVGMSDETPVKVMIKVGIFAGPKLLYNAGKLFGHCATVHDIIEGTLQRCGRAGCSVLTVSAFKSDEQQGLGCDIDLDDLAGITAVDLFSDGTLAAS